MYIGLYTFAYEHIRSAWNDGQLSWPSLRKLGGPSEIPANICLVVSFYSQVIPTLTQLRHVALHIVMDDDT